MKKQVFGYILIMLAFLVCAVVFTGATGDWFVNDSSNVLPQFFDGVYAVGKDGTERLSRDKVFALSAGGLYPLGAADSSGGGGLRYDDGVIAVRDDHVKVGLAYYYSSSRDSSLDSASLSNASGQGFLVGNYDVDGVFTEILTAASSDLILKAAPGNTVELYSGGSLLLSYDSTGRDNYLVVRALSSEDEEAPLTIFSQRKYYGDFCFAVLGNGKLTVVNNVDLEHYVMGVCACEMVESWPVEALKAQAVAARTYAQKMLRNSVYYYTCGFDVTDDTYCQAYLGHTNVGNHITEAAISTENQYLTYNGNLIDALYSAADGGATESNFNVFGNNSHPYLVGIVDPYEISATENPYLDWEVTMTPTALGNKVGIGPVKDAVLTYSDVGNVIKIELISESGQSAVLIRDSCRTVLGLKNIRFGVEKDDYGNFVFNGSGFGHNLGMSQWGAYAMAKHFGKDYKDILGFYYTGVGLSYGEIQ